MPIYHWIAGVLSSNYAVFLIVCYSNIFFLSQQVFAIVAIIFLPHRHIRYDTPSDSACIPLLVVLHLSLSSSPPPPPAATTVTLGETTEIQIKINVFAGSTGWGRSYLDPLPSGIKSQPGYFYSNSTEPFIPHNAFCRKNPRGLMVQFTTTVQYSTVVE